MQVLWISSTDQASNDESLLTAAHVSFRIAGSGAEGLNLLRSERFDATVVNAPLADYGADDLLEELKRAKPEVPVLVRDPQADLPEAVRLIKLGAFHFLGHSTPEELRAVLETACDFGRMSQPHTPRRATEASWSDLLIGSSHAMQNLVETVRLLANRKCTVLITGETGTGKELIARALHMASSRAALPMVAVNCSALPDTLLEAELFGHVRGAFTGAIAQRAGRFEQAHRSTLFLDEIAEMPLDVQTKLLRVLQEREFQRLGSSETVRVDVRVVAACNVDLEERARDGRFREDLFYRLNVIPIEVPPLRERRDDIPLLVRHFVDKVARAEGLPQKQVTPETLDRLMRNPWPGNIRQLENAVEMAMILSGERLALYPADFRIPSDAPSRRLFSVQAMPSIAVPDHGLDFELTVGRIERDILEQALRKTNGNKKQAAEMLGLKRTTLSAKLKSLEALAG